ncbi:MAG: glycosyltransferase family 2 protein [Cyanobacteria bacterium P01_A01_bin.105]
MTASATKLPVSVLIPAKNEEENLPACLESVARADEVFVVDSQSEDRSTEICESHGANVVQFHFNGRWPKKKNWSLENLPFRNDWVLIVDCDERITPELWDEIETAIQGEQDGFYLNRKVFFLGKWIRHGGKYPDWNLRLFRHQLGRYENLNTEEIRNTGDNEVHEHVVVEGGKVGYLKQDMLHIDFRDLYHWLARHNRYSNWEARVYYNLLTGMGDGGTIGANLFGDSVQRKRFLKKIWVRLPFKPLLRFILFYFIRLGFLDGYPGYIYGRLLSQYEYQIGVKLYELQFGGKLNLTDKDQQTVENTTPPASPLVQAADVKG